MDHNSLDPPKQPSIICESQSFVCQDDLIVNPMKQHNQILPFETQKHRVALQTVKKFRHQRFRDSTILKMCDIGMQARHKQGNPCELFSVCWENVRSKEGLAQIVADIHVRILAFF